MDYKPLFELNIFHDYYKKGICPDFYIEPTAECNKLLKGHRLIIKNKVNGINIVAPFKEDQIWIEIPENLRFTFVLKIKNKDFIDFTKIDWKPTDNAMYNYNFYESNEFQPLDEKIVESYLCYLKVPKFENILGVVYIYNRKLSQKKQYKINFKSKEKYWYYYLLSNNDKLLIKDTNKYEAPKSTIEFEKYKQDSITKEIDNFEEVKKNFSLLEKQFPGAYKYLFKSKKKITCKEIGIKNIQLLYKEDEGIEEPIVLIENLANPPNRNGIQVINALKYL